MIVIITVYLICSSVYIFMGITILSKDPKSKINKIFFTVCLNLSLWAFCYALVSGSTSAERAAFYNRLSSLFWSSFSSQFLYLSIYLTENDKYLKKLWQHIALFVPAIISIYLYFIKQITVCEIVQVPYGWAFLSPKGKGLFWDNFYSINYIIYTLISIWLIVQFGKKSKLKRVRKQAKVLTYSIITALAIGSITDIVLPLSGIETMPKLALVSILIVIGGIWYSSSKYKLMTLSTESVVLDVLKIMNDGLIIADQDGKVLNANNGALRLLGYEKNEIRGLSIKSLFHYNLEQFTRGISNKSETEIISKNNEMIPVSISSSVLLDDFGDELGTVIIFQNITEIKEIQKQLSKAHEAIKEDNLRLHDLINSLPGLVIVLKENYEVRFVNRNYSSVFGVTEGKFCYEAAGKEPCKHCRLKEVFQKEHFDKMEELLFNNRIYEVTMRLIRDVDGSRLVVRTLYDVTDRKEAEQELLRLQTEMTHLERLNLVGQMAAGIAHEIRNPLTTVRGYLQLMGSKREFQSLEPTFKLMIDELDRANMIISDYLALAKKSDSERCYQNINEILHRLYPLLEADTYAQNKKIVFAPGPTRDILLNTEEISQLVLNLCRNGIEAMGAGGTITLRTYCEDNHVVFSVQDEGSGIQAEYMDRLGTPFFTTKENGTGLGLSICYSIVERHGATIDIHSTPRGTTFFVRFPIPNGTYILLNQEGTINVR
ncbi:PAS domain S-box [Desulfosporosinus orientis DSM 765]|uniref:histidine kinase n=1 Tax=Desulfosporosinus orientis (strain ATCC 19365 / DSM 765 / NCIMB 8382 / VKM B-1628 / Singapore I) TaxID=768706 RepID=G7WH73_DESOD|nr:ATP-binding protein [Desulfosporosinus orientis]AET69581.1 PAS domain S-box [Desulfosporosinus orientis DSM 765]